MSIESRLSTAQVDSARAFLEQLSPEDRGNVEQITATLDKLITHYDKEVGEFGRDKIAIFGVYGIGGWVNKEGPRPDVDVLVMTNAKWDELGYYFVPSQGEKEYWYESHGDDFIEQLANLFGNKGFDVEIPDRENIPDEYSEGVSSRILIRLTPQEGTVGSPIDVVYIAAGHGEPPINSFEDFYEQDAGQEGALGRVALIETVVTKKAMPWRP